jgi:hypothetical protein
VLAGVTEGLQPHPGPYLDNRLVDSLYAAQFVDHGHDTCRVVVGDPGRRMPK